MLTRKEIRMIAEEVTKLLMEQERMKDTLITAAKAAEITGLSIKTLYNTKEKIGYSKMGRILMFSEKAIRAYAEGKTKD